MAFNDINKTVQGMKEELRLRQHKTEIAIERDQTELTRITAQIAILEEVLGFSGESPPKVAKVSSTNGKKMGPSDAIRDLLRKTPRLTGPEIINKLEGVVETSAQNVRHNIRTTLYNLAKTEKIEALDDDTYQLSSEY